MADLAIYWIDYLNIKFNFNNMKTISMLEFRKNAAKAINEIKQGRRFKLTYRGEEIAEMVPIVTNNKIEKDDPFYRITDLASKAGSTLNNDQIDKLIYGKE